MYFLPTALRASNRFSKLFDQWNEVSKSKQINYVSIPPSNNLTRNFWILFEMRGLGAKVKVHAYLCK